MNSSFVRAFLIFACLPLIPLCAGMVSGGHGMKDKKSSIQNRLANVHDDERIASAVIRQKLGSGAFGTVFRADFSAGDQATKQVAIKVIHKMNLTDQGYIPWTKRQLKSIATEVSILSTLFSQEHNAAYLLKSYGIFEDRSNIYMIMQLGYCDLCDLCRQYYPFPVGVVKSIASDVTRSVAFLHKNCVLIQDIKCDNIIISHEGRAMLIDFNLSKNDGSLEDDKIRGTIDYLPPEIANIVSFKRYDEKIDLWMLGCVIFMMSTKKLPFKTGKLKPPVPLKVIKNILKHGIVDADAVTRFDPNLTEIVLACLQKDPNDRPSAEHLLEYPYFKEMREDELESARQWLIGTLQEQSVEDDDADDLVPSTNMTRRLVKLECSERFNDHMPGPMKPIKVEVIEE